MTYDPSIEYSILSSLFPVSGTLHTLSIPILIFEKVELCVLVSLVPEPSLIQIHSLSFSPLDNKKIGTLIRRTLGEGTQGCVYRAMEQVREMSKEEWETRDKTKKNKEKENRKEKIVKVPEIKHGEPIIFKKSKFIGHVARVESIEEVRAVVDMIKSDPEFSIATHPAICAYRLAKPASENRGV